MTHHLRTLTLAALALVALLIGARPEAVLAQSGGEQIVEYRVDIRIESDGALTIVEDIAYDFGNEDRHGIFRDLPTTARYDDRYDRVYRLSNVRVTSSSRAPAQHEIENLQGGITRIKIGDPNRTISGRHAYRIEYRVEGALNAFDDHDELYWNAIGTQWAAPIAYSVVTVHLVPDAPAGDLRAACFAGSAGSGLACGGVRLQGNEAVFAHPPLDSYEGLTVVVGFPKGRVPAPTPILDERWSFQRAFTLGPLRIGLWAVVLAGVIWLLVRLVWRIGRDVRWRGAPVNVVFGGNAGEQRVPLFEGGAYAIEYTPPDGLRPGQIGTLLDEVAHPLDVTATIVDLAARGYLTITEIPKEGWFGSPDWQLIKQPAPVAKQPLLAYETLLLDSLFEDGDDILLSSLKQQFHTHLAAVQDALYEDAVARGWFAGNPASIRQRWLGIAIASLVGAIAVIVAAAAWTTYAIVPTPLILGALGLLTLHGRMPRRTAQGTAALRRTLGFRQFIETAETRRSEFAEKSGLFYDYLPFAVVFGSVDRWAKAFEGLNLAPPTWYASSYPFQAMMFANAMDGFATTTSGTLVSTPGSSGSSGFSGFSGGSSGGGGGGGGGGSW